MGTMSQIFERLRGSHDYKDNGMRDFDECDQASEKEHKRPRIVNHQFKAK